MSPSQEAILSSWLDAGGHTLLIFSQDLYYERIGDWVTPETDAFLADDVGALGDAVDGDLNDSTYGSRRGRDGLRGRIVPGHQGSAIASTATSSIQPPGRSRWLP